MQPTGYAEAILATIRQPLLVLDGDLRVQAANAAFFELFQLSFDETVGRLLYDLGDRQWDIPALRALLENMLPERRAVRDYPLAHAFGHLGQRSMLLNASRLDPDPSAEDGQALILLAIEDVTERQQGLEAIRRSEQRLTDLISALPNAIYTTDASGGLVFWNPAAEKFWGGVPRTGSKPWHHDWRLYHPDGRRLAASEYPIRLALRQQRPAAALEAGASVGEEILIELPQGQRRPFLAYPAPIHEADGTLWGAVNMLVDISGHKRAEQQAQRLAALVASSDDAIISKDLQGVITGWNQGATQLFGYAADEAIGRSVQLLIPAERQSEERRILARIRRGDHIQHYETQRQRKNGDLLWVSLTISPICDSQGRIVGISSITRDMSERRAADRHRKTLMDELNHRVKNTMAVVQAIAAQTLSSAGSLEEAGHSFSARLLNLAKAHDILTQGSWVSADLRDLVADTVKPHAGDGDRFEIEGPSAPLAPATALGISMALHELCTNAAKYGALSTPEGRVSIRWHVDSRPAGRRRLALSWVEHGGPPVAAPQRRGFGSRLIERAVATELEGEVRVDYPPGGVTCTILAPLPDGLEERMTPPVRPDTTASRP